MNLDLSDADDASVDKFVQILKGIGATPAEIAAFEMKNKKKEFESVEDYWRAHPAESTAEPQDNKMAKTLFPDLQDL